MEQAIRNFHRQFLWKPVIKNAEKLQHRFREFVVCGMGGSHLAAGLLACLKPELDIVSHRDYGLPAAVSDAKERLWIASSYSGNTEETIDFERAAVKKGFTVAAISTGKKLLAFARRNHLSYVVIPDMHVY